MNHQYIPYKRTGKFSDIVIDYLAGDPQLKPFFEFDPDRKGIEKAIEKRKLFPTNRQLLVTELKNQYSSLSDAPAVTRNIESLQQENTFTICTAHQPNIFTGHLYFIYKILHAIKLADVLAKELPQYNFVPVFFMGSEDADLDELNHFVLDGKKFTWKTNQKGAVGRMKIDSSFINLIADFSGRLLSEPFGIDLVTLLKECYARGTNIETATFHFVHALFKDFGIVVLLPDNAAYKNELSEIFRDELLNHTSSEIVKQTSASLEKHHHAQAFSRKINLFYMKGDIRNRIVEMEDKFIVHDTDIVFSRDEILEELKNHPERFSPNVILRGLFQEIILPGVAFIGGGGELAYWLQLKDLFHHYKVPYPVLFLRNSFLIIEEKWNDLMKKLDIIPEDIFLEKEKLLQNIVRQQSTNNLELTEETDEVEKFFAKLKTKAENIDPTLKDHVEALKKRQVKKLKALEKKLLSAEKKRFDASGRQLNKLYAALHADGLQERTENFMLFYAQWGRDFLDAVYEASPVWEPGFCLLIHEEKYGGT